MWNSHVRDLALPSRKELYSQVYRELKIKNHAPDKVIMFPRLTGVAARFDIQKDGSIHKIRGIIPDKLSLDQDIQ